MYSLILYCRSCLRNRANKFTSSRLSDGYFLAISPCMGSQRRQHWLEVDYRYRKGCTCSFFSLSFNFKRKNGVRNYFKINLPVLFRMKLCCNEHSFTISDNHGTMRVMKCTVLPVYPSVITFVIFIVI